MKIFIYKSMIIFFLIIIGFQLTFNYAFKAVQRKFHNMSSKENIDYYKNLLRSQITHAINKEKLLNEEDAKLIKKFLKKLNNELK